MSDPPDFPGHETGHTLADLVDHLASDAEDPSVLSEPTIRFPGRSQKYRSRLASGLDVVVHLPRCGDSPFTDFREHDRHLIENGTAVYQIARAVSLGDIFSPSVRRPWVCPKCAQVEFAQVMIALDDSPEAWARDLVEMPPNDLRRAAALDVVTGQTDRTRDNVMEYLDTRGCLRLAMIDNDDAFGFPPNATHVPSCVLEAAAAHGEPDWTVLERVRDQLHAGTFDHFPERILQYLRNRVVELAGIHLRAS